MPNEWQRDMHEFWHGSPCPDVAVCRVGTWEVRAVLFPSPRSELESASVDRGHAFVLKIQDVGTYPQRLVLLARVQRRPRRAHGPCKIAKMYILMSTDSLENNKRNNGDR